MKNLKLGARLGVAFATMMALIAIIVALAESRLSALDRESAFITTEVYPQVELAQTNALLVMDMARQTRNIVMLTDTAMKANYKAEYDKGRAKLADNLARLNQLVRDAEGKQVLARIQLTAEAFFPFNDEVVRLGLANENDEGIKLLFSARRQAPADFVAALGEFVEHGKAAMKAAVDRARATHQFATYVLLNCAALAILIGAAFAWYVTRTVTVPLKKAVDAAYRVARGDLSEPIVAETHCEAGSLLEALGRMQDGLAAMVSQVREGADSVATASAQIAQGNADLSQRTEEQASALQQTAATMHQLGTTINSNSGNAQTANQLTSRAADIANRGSQVVSQAVDKMKALNASSRKISEIISVIDGIAFQTNILALNAAVEAARAGEQGRGFAVVAGEVRSLAQRSAEAAKEIKTLITSSVEQVEQGTELVNQAGKTMDEIVRSIKRSSDLVSEISAVGVEQANGVSQVATAVNQMDQVTQQNAALVEESAAAASSLQSQAEQLVKAVAFFQLQAQPARTDSPLRSVQTARSAAVLASSRARSPKATSSSLKQVALANEEGEGVAHDG